MLITNHIACQREKKKNDCRLLNNIFIEELIIIQHKAIQVD